MPCLTAYTKFRQDSVQKVRAEVDELMEMVSLAEYLGAGCVRIFLGAYPEGHTREQSDSVATEGLCYAAEKMGSSPVKLVIETHDTGKCGRILGPLLRDVPPSVGVLLDIIHPWDMGEPIEETWRLIGDRIYHVHIKDIEASAENGRIYSRIGEGMLPVAETVDWLEGHGYDGFYSLEWEKSVEDRGVAFEDQLESFVQFMRGRK